MDGCRRRLLATCLILLTSVRSLFAQGTEALSFTRIALDPCTAALAGAGSASVERGAFSAFTGAVALPFLDEKADAAVSYGQWTPSSARTVLVSAAVAYKPSSRLGLSLGYGHQGPTALSGGYSSTAQIVALGAGLGLGERWSIGLNARYAMQRFSPADAALGGFSADLFAAWQPVSALRLSVGVGSLGTAVKSQAGSSFAQPSFVRLAAAWSHDFAQEHQLRLLLDGDAYFSGNAGLSMGAQYSWKKLLHARAGYRLASAGCVIPSHLGLGLGVNFHGLSLDLSYLTASPALSGGFAVGAGYRF